MSALSGLGDYIRSFGKTAEREYMPDLAGATLQDSPRLSRITVWLAAGLLLVALVWGQIRGAR